MRLKTALTFSDAKSITFNELIMDSKHWSSRYQNKQTGWDIGAASKPLIKLFNEFHDKNLNILIPGCGNAYEAEFLFHAGFTRVHIIDIAPEPLNAFKERNGNFPDSQIILGDFFSHKGEYDLIIEQTFFCAIDPNKRIEYVKKAYDLLHSGGKLIGVLFDREFEGGPPFGGNRIEYQNLFELKFSKVNITDSIHSIEPRQGSEVILRCMK